ncbi:phage integrase SAM-like domain-containing protein [Pedobacter sp. KLB.chiD]|uniref:site-specific integrase n=1 Tax=Pedobacter sp. KLB.chiD TaxID=3387402 RepID=UPI003999DE3D
MRKPKRTSCRLLNYCEHYINHNVGDKAKIWISFYKLLRMFEVHQCYLNVYLMSNSFDKSMLDLFIAYLKERGQAQTTVYNNFNKLRSMLNSCHDDGYDVNVTALKKTRVPHGESIAIYLDLEELKEIERLDVVGTKLHIRDLFLISCYTGLRYEDVIVLSKGDIVDDVIQIKTRKTGEIVVIPLHPVIREIFSRYPEGRIPSDFSLYYYNKSIKEIAQNAGIDEVHPLTLKPKWKMVSSRTGRRSFATNMYLSNPLGSVYPIMQITGHQTEESFFRYIRQTKMQNAKQLLHNHPFFQYENAV